MKEQWKEALHNPAYEYRIYPIFHELCDPGRDIRAFLDEQLATGIGGFVTNTTWTDPEWVYSPENVARLKEAADYAREKGMRVWMYDDYYYPSGFANGYAVKDHPEYIARNISRVILHARKGDPLPVPENCVRVLSARWQGQEIALPAAAEADGELTVYYVRDYSADFTAPLGASKGHLGFLDKEAVASFLHAGLDPIAEKMDMHSFEALFTDEPTLSPSVLCFPRNKVDFSALPLPWAPGLEEAYHAQWGETLRLEDLFTSLSPRAKLTRMRFYDTVSRMARASHTDQVRAWCHAHGTKASGHFLLEEPLLCHVGYYADFMRVMGGQDIPGCDVLCSDGDLFWEKGYGFDTSCVLAGKYPSSLARLEGHNTTMLEICPVCYTEHFTENSFEEFMALSGSVIFSGITRYNAYGYGYIKTAEEKQRLNAYVGRLLSVLRNSASAAKTAVYYPIHAMQALFAAPRPEDSPVDFYPEALALESDTEDLVNLLLAQKCDFNFIDDDHLLLLDGQRRVGQLTIDELLVPFTEYLPAAAANAIRSFEANGGRVVYLGSVPAYTLEGGETGLQGTAIPFREFTAAPCAPIEGNILLSVYTYDGEPCCLAYNKLRQEQIIRTETEADFYDPEHDTWYRGTEYTVAGRRACLVFL